MLVEDRAGACREHDRARRCSSAREQVRRRTLTAIGTRHERQRQHQIPPSERSARSPACLAARTQLEVAPWSVDSTRCDAACVVEFGQLAPDSWRRLRLVTAKDSDRFARFRPWPTKSRKAAPAATIIAEEERLFGQVQARVAMGEEDEGRPQIGASDLDQRSALAARSDRRGARRGPAAAGRADDAARGAQGAARRRPLAAGRHHVAVLRAHAAARGRQDAAT